MLLPCFNWEQLSQEQQTRLLARPQQKKQLTKQVAAIIEQVRQQGDEALRYFSETFDNVSLADFAISAEEINAASISSEALEAISMAIDTITAYHQACKPQPNTIEHTPGICIERIYRPIQSVGLYVPGGNNTPLISSLLMQAIPAKIAGCPRISLCTPPNQQGVIDPHLLVAAKRCGIETIYRLGGAQAIAAMAYGTQSIAKVNKLFGPGNAYVTEAKSQVAADPFGAAIDMPAGPSEVMIVADQTANPDFVAADLLAQAEHGSDSQVFLLCNDEQWANSVKNTLKKQFLSLSRQAIMQQALQHSAIIVCSSTQQQLALINRYAPEHLILNCQQPRDWVDDVESAGTIFLGPWAAETLGDYMTGSNHILPTYGYAKNHSGLSTRDFMKAITVQSVDKAGMLALGKAAKTLAQLERLDAHANAITIRLTALEGYLC